MRSRLPHHLHPGELLRFSEPRVRMRGGRHDVLAREQIVGLVDLPVANQPHHAIRDRGHDVGGEDHPGARSLRVQSHDPVHSPGPLKGLGDRVGSVLLDREAESQHAASLETARDA